MCIQNHYEQPLFKGFLFLFEEFFQESEAYFSENYLIQSVVVSYCFLFAISLVMLNHSMDQVNCGMNCYVLLASSSDSAQTWQDLEWA